MKPKQRYVAKINPIVFWIIKHALFLLRGLFKISIHINGAKNIPDGAIIFVANHFTRLETVFLPYELYCLTGKPVMSLAHHGLFKHILGTFLESVGSVSTKAPHRDVTIIRSLLKGNHPWLIFPEGGMIKDKKVMENGKLRISGKNGRRRPPHAGAALLALRAEFYRQRLRYLHHKNPSLQKRQLNKLQLSSLNEVNNRQTFLVPVNLSYYPFRPRKNTLEKLTTKFLGGIPDRMQDELRTEGTMLFSGVRMDNPFQVILNEVEILQHLTGRLQRIARYPHWRVNRYLNKTKNRFSKTKPFIIRQPSDNKGVKSSPFSYLQTS